MLCDEAEVERELDEGLPNTEVGPKLAVAGVRVSCEVVVRSEVPLTYVDGFTRFSEWDYLTNLGEVAGMIDRESAPE